MNTDSNSSKVPLSSQKRPQAELDISGGLSKDDLESLRKTDPFMYYSIPEVRNATLLHHEVVVPCLRRESGPKATGPLTHATAATAVQSRKVVRRQSSISFEVYPDVLLEDLLEDGSLYESLESEDLLKAFADMELKFQ